MMKTELASVLLLLICHLAVGDLRFKVDGTFKIIHVSDTHYEIGPATPCRDVVPGPCSLKNTTDLINQLIEIEKPDLVVHTGDIVDWATNPSQDGMDALYGVSIAHDLPWAASLGNHDAQSNLNRSSVMHYIVGMKDTLAAYGPTELSGSAGNYWLDILTPSNSTGFRFWFLDSTDNNASINSDQVAWYSSNAKSLKASNPAPALMFFHIPLVQYQIAVNASGAKISGSYNEQIAYQPDDTGLYQAMKEVGDVCATFCGHDHTNDFCVGYENVNFCYEGSPGYQAYGLDSFLRRSRVTELRAFGKQAVTWKRLSDNTVVDTETIYQQSNGDDAATADADASPFSWTSGPFHHRRAPPANKHELRARSQH